MKKYLQILVCALLFLLPQIGFSEPVADDFMHQTGKIYVVVAVIVSIFIGIVGFLIFIDKKVSKLEQQLKENE